MPSGGKFNPMDYILGKVYFRRKYLEIFPECEQCDEVNAITFSKTYYFNWVKTRVCPECKIFKDGLDQGEWAEEEHNQGDIRHGRETAKKV